jgi:hypothetical protein
MTSRNQFEAAARALAKRKAIPLQRAKRILRETERRRRLKRQAEEAAAQEQARRQAMVQRPTFSQLPPEERARLVVARTKRAAVPGL